MGQYTITEITPEGDVKVVFDIDNKEQVISGFPTDDAEILKDSLARYGAAYEEGLIAVPVEETPVVEIPVEVEDILNVPQEFESPPDVKKSDDETPPEGDDSPKKVSG